MASRTLTEDFQTGRLTLQESTSYRIWGLSMLVIGVVVLFIGFSGPRPSAGAQLFAGIMGLGVGGVGAYLMLAMDTVVLDPQTKTLVKSSGLLFYRLASTELPFSEIANVEVKYYLQTNKYGGSDRWNVKVIDRSGNTIAINEDGGRDEMMDLGQRVAALTGAPLLDHSHKGQTLLDKIMGREGDVQPPDPDPNAQPAAPDSLLDKVADREGYIQPPDPAAQPAAQPAASDSYAGAAPLPAGSTDITADASGDSAPARLGISPGVGALIGMVVVILGIIFFASLASRPRTPVPTRSVTATSVRSNPAAGPTLTPQFNSARATALAQVAEAESAPTATSPISPTATPPTMGAGTPTASQPYSPATAVALEQAPIVLADDFHDDSNGWGTSDFDGALGTAKRSVAGGRYIWTVAAGDDNVLYRSGPPAMNPLSDFSYSVQCQRSAQVHRQIGNRGRAHLQGICESAIAQDKMPLGLFHPRVVRHQRAAQAQAKPLRGRFERPPRNLDAAAALRTD
ncbi:MAG: hypothetical protein WCF84_06345 [Anaerolineae bacterium]